MAFAAGHEMRTWINTETTYNTALTPGVTLQAVDLIELNIEPEYEFTKQISHVGTASLQGEIAGKKGGKWTAVSYVRPQTAGSEPDVGPMMEAGVGSVSGSTYSLADGDASDTKSVQLIKWVDSLGEFANGAWVEQIDFELEGGQPPRITFSGGFASYGWFFGGTVNSAHTTPVTTMTLDSSSLGLVGKNARIWIGSHHGTDSQGFLVTAGNETGGSTITVAPAITDAVSAGTTLSTMLTTGPSVSGTIQGGVDSDLQINSTSISFVSFKCSLKTGVVPVGADEADAEVPRGLMRAMREIEAEAVVVWETGKEFLQWMGRAWAGATTDVTCRFGPTTANNKMTISLPKCRVDITPIETPEAEMSMATLKFIPRQSAAAADEMTVTFA